jgi:hypothetical protein
MESDVPETPSAQKVQPEVKDVSQTPQQSPAVPQTPTESTPPTKSKMQRKTKILIVFVVLASLVAGAVTYFYFSGEKFAIKNKEWFQTGNTQEITKLQTKTSEELEDNRIGDMRVLDVFTEDYAEEFVDHINDVGLKWTRLSIDWFDWDEIVENGAYSKHHIYPSQDKVITDLKNKGIKVKYTLLFWDTEAPSFTEDEEQEYSRFKTEEEIERYLDYVKFIVSNFKGRIKYYEILNEQNHCEGTQQHVKLGDYINLVKRVVPVIREEDPNAKIVAGSVADLRQPPFREYFFGFIKSDVMPLIDGISFHPMYGVSPEYNVLRQYYYEYPSLIQEIKDISSAHGFKGEYFADELVWRTPIDPNPDEKWMYSETKATKYYVRGIAMNLGMDLTTGIALGSQEELPFMMGAIKNLATVMAGTKPTGLSIEIESSVTNIESYSFSLSNGDKLVALWTDGVAVDEDPGINAILTISNLSAQKVTGIDVLEGYQQDVVTDNEGGNLVVQNLKVRDYPLILHINK